MSQGWAYNPDILFLIHSSLSVVGEKTPIFRIMGSKPKYEVGIWERKHIDKITTLPPELLQSHEQTIILFSFRPIGVEIYIMCSQNRREINGLGVQSVYHPVKTQKMLVEWIDFQNFHYLSVWTWANYIILLSLIIKLKVNVHFSKINSH